MARVDKAAIMWTIAIVAAGVGFTSLGSNFQSQAISELPSEESRMGTQIIQQSAPSGYIGGKGGEGIIPPQDEATAAKEKKGLNAVNVKLAIAKLKDELKSNPNTLKLLKVLEDEIAQEVENHNSSRSNKT